MSVQREVNLVIFGEVNDDIGDNDYSVMEAELKVICAKYGLDIRQNYGE